MDGEMTQQAAPATEAPHTEAPHVEEHHEEAPKLGLRTDERTGRKIVEPITTPQPQEEPKPEPAKVFEKPTEQQAPQPQQVQPQQTPPQTAPVPPQGTPPVPTPAPNYYSAAEMSLAMQLGNVDESRIPPAYQPQYQALKQKDAPPPKTEAELRTEFLDTVSKMAKEKAMKDVGLTEDELAMGDFSDDESVREKMDRFKTAMEINRTKIINGYSENLRMEQLKAQRENEFKQGVASWINDQRASEPNFDAIGTFMVSHVKEMPYEKAVAIAPSIDRALKGQLTEQDAEIVKGFYDECRKEFYAKKNGTSTTPSPRSPSVESKGTGKDVNKAPDYAEMLRNAAPRDKPQIIQAWLGAMNNR